MTQFMQDVAAARRILAANIEWLGEGFELGLDNLLWGVCDGVFVAYHPTTSDSTWMMHIASERGAAGHRVFRAAAVADRWFKAQRPEVKKLVAFIRSDNLRALRSAGHIGFEPEGRIRDYYFKDEKYHDIVILGRRQ